VGAALLLGILVPGTPAVAGPFEAELGSDAGKVAQDVKISMMNGDGTGVESGEGLVPYLKVPGGQPRRVALVSLSRLRRRASASRSLRTLWATTSRRLSA
jgi:hypothetical protein